MLKISLLAGILGVVILFFVSSGIEISEKPIDAIDKENLEEKVKLTGMVNRITELNTTTFIELTQPSKMDIIVFKEKKGNLSIQKGDKIEIIGNIDEYEGNLEVVAQRIRVIG